MSNILLVAAFQDYLERRSFFMSKCYLVYEKETGYDLAVAVCDSIKELMRFLGVSRQHVYRLLSGQCQHKDFGIFVDETLEDEGAFTATKPPQNTEHKR